MSTERSMPDTDIGQCDDCGTEDGPRTPTPRVVTINSQPASVVAWLCPDCREWAAECEEFGCTEPAHSTRSGRHD